MVGFMNSPSETLDTFFANTLRNHLFNGGNNAPGMDLIALNMQRGRDHGIPGSKI